MRREAALADRAAEVRRAGRAWRRAGVIDDAGLAAIDAAHPDDRRRTGPVFRVLLFLFTLVAADAAFGFLALLLQAVDSEGGLLAGLSLVAGIALVAATEALTGPMRNAQSGVEEATAFLAVTSLLGAAAWFAVEPLGLSWTDALHLLCLLAAALFAAAAWRWGAPAFGAFAYAAALGFLAALPGGRLLWIAAGLAAAPPLLLAAAESPRLPPALRATASWVGVVAVAGLYVAVHPDSLSLSLVELIGGRAIGTVHDAGWGPARLAGAAAIVLLPVALLVAGILRRRRLPLLLALLAGTGSIVTFHAHVRGLPLWAVLAFWGAAATGAALALRRHLAAGAHGERAGFTAEPLLGEATDGGAVELAAVVVSLAPAPATHPPGDDAWRGGGGQFGGGGASDSF